MFEDGKEKFEENNENIKNNENNQNNENNNSKVEGYNNSFNENYQLNSDVNSKQSDIFIVSQSKKEIEFEYLTEKLLVIFG